MRDAQVGAGIGGVAVAVALAAADHAASGNVGQLPDHLNLGKENGLTKAEIYEALTHVAFYVGWPKGITAITSPRPRPPSPLESRLSPGPALSEAGASVCPGAGG